MSLINELYTKMMNRFLDKKKIEKYLVEYKYLIITYLYLFFLGIYLQFKSDAYNFIETLLHPLMNALILILIILLLSKLKYLRIVFSLFLTLVISIDVTYVMAFDSHFNYGAAGSMFETDLVEAKGFLLSNLKYSIVIVPIFFLFYKSLKEASQKKTKKLIMALSICSVLYLGIHGFFNYLRKDKFTTEGLQLVLLSDVFGKPLLLGINSCLKIFAYHEEMKTFRAYTQHPKEIVEGASFFADSTAVQNVFIVIGESSLRSHYSLYNYKYPTTPVLDSLSSINKLKYYNAIAVAPVTRQAIKYSLSFASPLDRKLFYENHNVISMANLVGYNSFWISNQIEVGLHDSNIGMLASYAKDTEFFGYQKDDLELLDIVEQKLNNLDDNSKNIFFIHLKGSHLSYEDKFTDNDATYLKEHNVPSDDPTFDYDCSIKHIDSLLNKLFNIMQRKSQDKPSIIVYYSDHGEVVNKGHGMMLNAKSNKFKDQFQIPFIIIPSDDSIDVDKYVQPYLDCDGIFNSNSLSYILSSFLGYTFDDKLIEKANNEAQYFEQIDGSIALVKDYNLFVK